MRAAFGRSRSIPSGAHDGRSIGTSCQSAAVPSPPAIGVDEGRIDVRGSLRWPDATAPPPPRAVRPPRRERGPRQYRQPYQRLSHRPELGRALVHRGRIGGSPDPPPRRGAAPRLPVPPPPPHLQS